jgi:diphthamide biosynthesis protein 4
MENMEPKVKQVQLNYYQILGVEQDASVAEIKKQYQKLCLLYHPDKSNSTIKLFYEIQQAYHELMNNRTNYNLSIQKKLLLERINLDDMEYDDSRYTTTCRCGAKIFITEAELEDQVNVVDCEQCTLSMEILYEILE